jgi:hypothetical protein
MEKYLIDVHLCDVVVEALFFFFFVIFSILYSSLFLNVEQQKYKKMYMMVDNWDFQKLFTIRNFFFSVFSSSYCDEFRFPLHLLVYYLIHSVCWSSKFHFNYPFWMIVKFCDEKNKFKRNTRHIELSFNTMNDDRKWWPSKIVIFLSHKTSAKKKRRKKSHQNVWQIHIWKKKNLCLIVGRTSNRSMTRSESH